MTRSITLFRQLARALARLAKISWFCLDVHRATGSVRVRSSLPAPQPHRARPRRQPWKRLAAILRLEVLELRVLPTITNFQLASSISVVEGTATGVTIGTFDDSDPNTLSDVTATVDWGAGNLTLGGMVNIDGSTTAGWTITDFNSYTEDGSHTISVSLSDSTAGGSGPSGTIPATATEAALTAGSWLTTVPHTFYLNKQAAVAFEFFDANTYAVASDYTVTLNWGDGSGAQTVSASGSNGDFTSGGTHTYTSLGAFTVQYTATDDGNSVSASGTIIVVPVPSAVPVDCGCTTPLIHGSAQLPAGGFGSPPSFPLVTGGTTGGLPSWTLATGGTSGDLPTGSQAPSAPSPGWFLQSNYPVRYFDGTNTVSATDLSGDGFDPFGQTRVWTNAPEYATGNYNGYGWSDSDLLFVIDPNGDQSTLIVMAGGSNALFFDWDSGTASYQERFYGQDQLTHDSMSDEYTLVQTDGSQITFAGFTSTWTTPEQGQLVSYTDGEGNVTSVTAYTSDGKIAQIERSNTTGGTTITEAYAYSYIASGTDAGLLQSVTLERKVGSGSFSTVREVVYTYYNGTTSGGNAGDLETAVIEDGSSNTLQTYYYRYYTNNTTATSTPSSTCSIRKPTSAWPPPSAIR